VRVTTAFNRLLRLPGASVIDVSSGGEGVIVSVRLCRRRRKTLPSSMGSLSSGHSTQIISLAVTPARPRHAVEISLWALKPDGRVRTVQDPDTFRDLLYAVVTGQRNHEDSRRKGIRSASGGSSGSGYMLTYDSRPGALARARALPLGG